jgi:hypothetical protein
LPSVAESQVSVKVTLFLVVSEPNFSTAMVMISPSDEYKKNNAIATNDQYSTANTNYALLMTNMKFRVEGEAHWAMIMLKLLYLDCQI